MIVDSVSDQCATDKTSTETKRRSTRRAQTTTRFPRGLLLGVATTVLLLPVAATTIGPWLAIATAVLSRRRLSVAAAILPRRGTTAVVPLLRRGAAVPVALLRRLAGIPAVSAAAAAVRVVLLVLAAEELAQEAFSLVGVAAAARRARGQLVGEGAAAAAAATRGVHVRRGGAAATAAGARVLLLLELAREAGVRVLVGTRPRSATPVAVRVVGEGVGFRIAIIVVVGAGGVAWWWAGGGIGVWIHSRGGGLVPL